VNKESDVIEKFLIFIDNKGFTEKNYHLLTYKYASSLYGRVPGKKMKREIEGFAKEWIVGADCKDYQTFTETINEIKEILDQLVVSSEIKSPIKRQRPPGELIERINIGLSKVPHPTFQIAHEIRRDKGKTKVYPDYSQLYSVTSPTNFKDYLFYPISLMLKGKWEEWAWLRKCKRCGTYFIDHTKNHTQIFCQNKCRVYYHRKPVTAKA